MCVLEKDEAKRDKRGGERGMAKNDQSSIIHHPMVLYLSVCLSCPLVFLSHRLGVGGPIGFCVIWYDSLLALLVCFADD